MAQHLHKPAAKGGKTAPRDHGDRGAWDIIDMEADARVRKTARLRELRLQKEAEALLSESPKPAKATKRKH